MGFPGGVNDITAKIMHEISIQGGYLSIEAMVEPWWIYDVSQSLSAWDERIHIIFAIATESIAFHEAPFGYFTSLRPLISRRIYFGTIRSSHFSEPWLA